MVQTNMINARDVAELRKRTGAGMMDCKKALTESGGDMDKAAEYLRKKGIASAAKRASRSAGEGIIGSYVHHNGKIAVLVELNCETDFVARTDDFQQLARDIAMHIASADPIAVATEDVPADVVERERSIFQEQVKESGKPDAVHQKIVDGKLKKFFAERVLLEQPFVKDDQRTVGQLVKEVSGTLGENVVVRRFVRFEVGAA